MTVELDAEVAAALAPVREAMKAIPPLVPGDWRGRREVFDAAITAQDALLTAPDGVVVTSCAATAEDGASIPLRLYRPTEIRSPALAVHLHGGGMFLGGLDTHDSRCRAYAALSGVALLSVGYRLAPEHPHPVPVEDCYAALRWAADNAPGLGVDPRRVAVMGDSAGGGLAAGVALLARDRGGPDLAAQILIQPMLDDRTIVARPDLDGVATWTVDDNLTGWTCLLGEAAGGPDTPGYATPGRATDLTGLPPAYVETGQLDLFREEDVSYADRLGRAGVPVELVQYPAVPHAFDTFAPAAAVSRRAIAGRVQALRAL
ncbi:alpha/beta hydrolase [Umezawaea endophytica]|uniref:Alpha/beta hydrolase n=1 Tax=Umezawaea endophytica TaxID=1654476 RepID=A0A9X2ZZ14_9PSEU|nr:alpha/beta hydrolase [Umezawaea endophytica]MCS7476924.1 alpha/beta hydrolase [Umezawaea endophytica]